MDGYALQSESKYPKLVPLPINLKHFCFDDKHTDFNTFSSYYNNILSFASIGVDNGREKSGFEKIIGDHAVKLNGRTYFVIPNSSKKNAGINYFLFDALQELKDYGSEYNNNKNNKSKTRIEYFREKVLEGLFLELKEINEFAVDLNLIGKTLKDKHLIDRKQNIITTNNKNIAILKSSINEQTHHLEIGAIVSDLSDGNIVFKYQIKNEINTIKSNSKFVEPLCFPLLHPYGEYGWDSSIKDELQLLPYILSRWLMPEITYDNNIKYMDVENENNILQCKDKNINGNFILCKKNKIGNAIIPTNRFQIMNRVAQYHLVDAISRSIDFKLQWQKSNQTLIFGTRDNSFDDFYREDNEMSTNNIEELNQQQKLIKQVERENFSNSNPSFLAASFHGGPRHLKQLANNSLIIVSKLGDPTIFLTATCNPIWPEIVEMLLPGQTAFDRPDITVRIFHEKLKILLKNIRDGYYFGDSTVVYELRVIEYQHRGLPHAHVVFKLSNVPPKSDEDNCCEWIDRWISAEMPDPIYEKELYCKVSTHMIHQKCKKGVNGCLREDGTCKKGFSNVDLRQKTRFDEKGYPVYRKRNIIDLRVVSYHKQILIDWDGHINVAFCGKSFVVLYLYKYLFKGNKKLKILFDNTKDVHDDDEITHYLRGRLICSMDAMWRCFGYQTYPSTFPSITLIKVKLPYHLKSISDEGKISDLDIYFKRPKCLCNLTYTEFYDNYDYGYSYPKKYETIVENITNLNNINNYVFDMTEICLTILSSSKIKKLYIYKRLNPNDSICRMSMVYIYMGEIYYLRLLLLNIPAFGYDDLLTYNGTKYTLFQNCALARKLITNETLGLDTFKEASNFSTPSERRNLFVMLTLQGYPTLCIFENEEMLKLLYEDYFNDFTNNLTFHNTEYSKNKLMETLQTKFQDNDRSLEEYGLPNPITLNTELEREKFKYNITEQNELFIELDNKIPNNIEQEIFLKDVYNSIEKNISKIYFLAGSAGTGKSTMMKKIIYKARSQNKIVLGCAATALAAQVYENFDTFHGLFKYPVVEEMEDIDQIDCIELSMSNYPQRKELINAASIIIWDEAPSNEYHCFKTVYEYFDCFKGKIIICLGDWKQTPPVVKYGSVSDICKASIINSPIWSLFNVFKLTINMRLLGEINANKHNEEYIQKQKDYANMLINIGEGNCDNVNVIQYEIKESDKIYNDMILYNEDTKNINSTIGLQTVKILILNYTNNIDDAINFVFPDQFNCIENLCDSAILCATNKSVNKWNNLIQSYNPEEENILLSYDTFDSVDDTKNVLKKMITKDVLESYNMSNVPPHKLNLKINDICFIMRNLNKKEGLTNNTRVRIMYIGKNFVRVCTLNKYPKFFNIPRIRFNVNLPYGKSFTMCRLQFPLRLAYSMTYNKSQGQELNKCLVDITSPPFVHGHLYVALSRIRNCENIKIFYDNETLFDEDDKIPVLQNYVYKTLKIM